MQLANNKIVVFILPCFLIYSCSNNANTNSTSSRQDSIKKIIDTFKNNNASTNKSPNCITVVTDILTTSNRYKTITKGLEERVIKNGGTGYGFTIEGSPNPTQDSALANSKTYDFSLHESYPDHEPVIARFSFDKSTRQLYELDIMSDSLLPIDFNKKLLLVLDKICH